MADSTKILLAFIVFLFFPLVLLIRYQFYAPKFEAARREAYEQSAPYVQGKINSLNKLKAEYALADESQQKLLKSVIIREAGTIDHSLLPEDLKYFLNTLN